MRAVLAPHELTHVQFVLLASRALADVEAVDDDYFASLGAGRDGFLDALATLDAG
jgi:hypothetical protein